MYLYTIFTFTDKGIECKKYNNICFHKHMGLFISLSCCNVEIKIQKLKENDIKISDYFENLSILDSAW